LSYSWGEFNVTPASWEQKVIFQLSDGSSRLPSSISVVGNFDIQ